MGQPKAQPCFLLSVKELLPASIRITWSGDPADFGNHRSESGSTSQAITVPAQPTSQSHPGLPMPVLSALVVAHLAYHHYLDLAQAPDALPPPVP